MPLYGSFQYGSARYGFEPIPPQNVQTSEDGASITITWDANPEPYVDKYLVERQADGGSWEQIGDVAYNKSSYTDNGVEVGPAYAYRLRAADDTANN